MSIVTKYRHFLSALLLLLYLFIATPVHWWHQHQQANTSEGIAFNHSEGKNTLTAHTGGSYTSYCNTCSHTYSIYAAAETYYHQTFTCTQRVSVTGYRESAPAIPILLSSNKGPPTLLA